MSQDSLHLKSRWILADTSHICVTLNSVTKVCLYFPVLFCISIPFILLDMKKWVPPNDFLYRLFDISDWEHWSSPDCMATTICAHCLWRHAQAHASLPLCPPLGWSSPATKLGHKVSCSVEMWIWSFTWHEDIWMWGENWGSWAQWQHV